MAFIERDLAKGHDQPALTATLQNSDILVFFFLDFFLIIRGFVLLTCNHRVSLKTRLGPKDLHRLIYDVRRRVEHEITYEGTERRIK